MKYKYAVVICPNCKNARIIEQGKKTMKCTHCNKLHFTKNLRVQFETNNQQDARRVIGIIHASLNGKEN